MSAANGTHVEKGPIVPALMSFALPVLALQLMQELYNITDCMIVGHFGGDHALAATGVAGLLLSILINFFVGFSSGISVVTSRLYGAYDYRELNRTLNAVVRMVLLIGLGLSVLSACGADPILRLLRSPDAVRPGAARYFRVCACGLAAQMLYNVGAAFLRSIGDTRTPLLFYSISVTCNLALDIALVAVLHKGIVGAAAATLCSQWLLAGMVLIYLARLKGGLALRPFGDGLTLNELGRVVGIGLPAGLQALFMSVSSLLIQVNINGFGPDAIAGMTLFAKLEGCLYLPAFAYGIALTSFVGQNLGAGRLDRVRSALRLSVGTMAGVILPLSLALSAASPWLLKLFTREPAILFNAHEAVIWTLPFYVVYAINQVYLGTIKGLGDTAYPMFATLICYSLFRVLWCRLLIPRFPTMRVVYLSYVVSFFLMLLLLLPRYRAAVARSATAPPERRE
ncbi:MAG: MATE family efflux transporter [Clostridia bacterium]|nr:MATE family efflux transporter [Clostridia bacterium]